MATSLSNETSSASLVELSQNTQLSGSSISHNSNYATSTKAANSDAKLNFTGSQNSNLQSSNGVSSSNYGASTSSYTKSKGGDSAISSTTPSYTSQSSNLISNSAGLSYPFLYPNSIFPGLSQASSQSQYNYQGTGVGSSTMQSNSTSQPAQSNRRGGKKKAPATQSQNPETRLFFNMRRRETQTQPNKGSSHFYKPKNPPSLSEWYFYILFLNNAFRFKKLSVEERVNTLSTVYPHLIETFLTMLQRIDERGESYFALRERNYMDYKTYNTQSYHLLQYHNFPHILSPSSSDSDVPMFDQHFYQRVQNENELQTFRSNEREKLAAEQEILKQVRLTHYFDSLDTVTVSEDLVQDSDLFFKLMSFATNNSAFQSPSQYFFDTKNQQNLIEYPNWFKPKSFHCFATWVIVALEENIWAHYNYDNNTNLGTAKVNELSSLFREKTDRGSQDVELVELSKFWGDMPENEKKSLIGHLQINAVKEVEVYENNLSQSGSGFKTKSSKSGHSKNMHYSVQVKEKKEIPEKSNSQLQTEQELSYYIDISQRQGYEQEMMTQLMYTRFGNTHHRQVLICKTFLDLIKKQYKDDLMENLLLEESIKQNKNTNQAQGQGKKKKKKNANTQQQSLANQTDKPGQSVNSDSQNTTLELQEEVNKPIIQSKKKGKTLESIISDKQASNMSSLEQTSTTNNGSNNLKKKKKNNHIKSTNHDQDTQGNISINQDSHSCDEQQIKLDGNTLEIESDVKSSSIGLKSQSNLYDNTTAHQSNNSNSNSSATIASTTPNNTENILQIQSSKSLDLNTVVKSKPQTSSNYKQSKPVSKVESKNYHILQNSQNSESDKRNKVEKKIKQNNVHNTYSDNIIFSEDDRQSKKLINIKDSLLTSESENESMEVIRQYVRELTNDMIDKVCMHSERTNSKSSSKADNDQINLQKSQHTEQPDYYNLGAAPPSQNQRKISFYKKNNRKPSNQVQSEIGQQLQNNSEKRKISFNNSKKQFKDEKKFSEDFAENISNKSYHKGSSVASVSDHTYACEETTYDKRDSQHDSQTSSKNQRKGFGIHLKTEKVEEKKQVIQPVFNTQENDQPQAWAKGTVKQTDLVQIVKPKNQKKPQSNVDQKEKNVQTSQKIKEKPQDQKLNDDKSIQDDLSVGTSQQNKKRRNRKKNKLNDTDIMNNFMKNLQASQDDVKQALEQKIQGQFKKKSTNTNQGQIQKATKPHINDVQSERIQSISKIDTVVSQNNPETKNIQSRTSQYKQRPQKANNAQLQQQTNLNQNQIPVVIQQQKLRDENKMKIEPRMSLDYNDSETFSQNQNLSQSQSQQSKSNNGNSKDFKPNQKNFNGPKNQNKLQKHQSHNQQLINKQNEDLESINSNIADCISEKSFKSFNEKVLNSDITQSQISKTVPFRYLKFKQGNEFDNNSQTDQTGTTNTAADTSLENCVNQQEETKDPIIIQDQENHIQVSLTDSIDAQNLFKNNAFAYTLQQFSSKIIESTMQRTLHEPQDVHTVPPQLQSPQSVSSSQQNMYTPYNMQQNQINSYHSISNFDLNEKGNNGYQSFQSTPQKNQLMSSQNPYKMQNLPLSSQVSQNIQETGQHYRTPPQISKKTTPQYNYSNNGTYRKSNVSNQPPSQPQKSYQVKEYYQPQPKQNTGYVQQMPMAQMMQEPQFIHQYQDPNLMYYQEQNMYMNQNPLVDNFGQRPQDQVFQYVEKTLPQQINQSVPYYPPNQMPINNFSPGMIQQPDPNQIPFNYKRPQQPYYDQGQDLILQIFNSIKFNQQSLSPIPQCMNSPPPIVDFQQIQNQNEGFQMPQRIDSSAYLNSENAFYDQFDKEIQNFTQSIQNNLESLKPERDYVYEKILKITQEVFQGQTPALQLFGSLITGLALESSDMDLAVTGLFIEDRFAVICELNKLSNSLQTWECLSSFKSIETASIPVIKMKIDLEKLREMEMPKRSQTDFDERPISEEMRYLSVDITFDDSSSNSNMGQMAQNLFAQDMMGQSNITKTHLGLQSCVLVQYYIANYQNLKDVSILLKKFLAIHKYNSPYYGGISSYSTVILLVAYMNYFELRGNHNLSPSRLLMGFLDFYGNFYNSSSWGINVYNEGSFYHLNSMLDSNIVILDPLNLSNNTTRNSYLTKEILLKFQSAFKNLKSLTLKNPQLHNTGLSSQTVLQSVNSQDQNPSIPFERTSPQETNYQICENKLQYTSQSQYQFVQTDWQMVKDQGLFKQPEEIETSNLRTIKTLSESEEPPFNQVNLLETFFAIETQTVIDVSRESSSQLEPNVLSFGASQISVNEMYQPGELESQ